MPTPSDPGDAAPLKAVLFDSGGVLMQPIGGRWHPRADFESTVLQRAPGITAKQFAEAFAAGERFMAAAASTPDLDQYHALVLEHLGVLPTPELLAELTRPVPANRVPELFGDVLEMRPGGSEQRVSAVPAIVSLRELIALFDPSGEDPRSA